MERIDTFRKTGFVYRDCSIRMSQKSMASIMYAVIMTHANIPTTYGLGVYQFTRKQNSFNGVEIKIHIHESMIPLFEELSGVKLELPIQVQIN